MAGRGASAPPSGEADSSFLAALDDEQREALLAAGRRRAFRPPAALVHQGEDSDHVFLVRSGWVKVVSTTPAGHTVTLAVRGPGDILGESAALSGRLRSATVIALTPVDTLVVPASRFAEILDTHPMIWRVLSGTLARRLDDANGRVRAQATLRGEQCLALLLVHLAELSAREAPPNPDGSIDIAPPLSQTDLGSWLSLSRETVARGLLRLRRNGLVRTGWRRITVTDLDALLAFATTPLD
ncbi:Crp/Fnr family transcriptional regulator [Actinomadura gamaensis]|uniref:Crp/Fnr family transcriptional regulator n=1 Tax=Actinomadura gamaensis TaxID=1763541 RepID=A0ABV9TYU9_9ACTN